MKFLKVTIDKVDGLNDEEEKVIETNLPESMVLSGRAGSDFKYSLLH